MKKKGCLLVAGVGLVLLTVIVGILFFALPPGLPKGPLRFVRGENGKLERAGETRGKSGFSFEFKAAQLNSNSTLSSESTSFSSNTSRAACRRVVVLNHSDHLLMRRIGPALARRLGEYTPIEEVATIRPARGQKPVSARRTFSSTCSWGS